MNEIAESARLGIELVEESIPVSEEVGGACKILGFDPLYVANEGKLIAFAAPDDAEKLLEAMRKHPLGKKSAAMGRVVAAPQERC